VQFNEKKITNPASFAKDLLGYLGSARASRATFGVGGAEDFRATFPRDAFRQKT